MESVTNACNRLPSNLHGHYPVAIWPVMWAQVCQPPIHMTPLNTKHGQWQWSGTCIMAIIQSGYIVNTYILICNWTTKGRSLIIHEQIWVGGTEKRLNSQTSSLLLIATNA